jgi:serine kinase of HPr protein (carbohydrate metabolism regulator)
VARHENIHATAMVIGDRGVVVLGPSGAGKSGLALEALYRARLAGRHASLVSDDQVLVEGVGGRLLAHAPPSIAGLAELRGLGPIRVAHQASAIIDLAVQLVEPQEVMRLPDPQHLAIAGCELPLLRLPRWRTAENWIAMVAALDDAAILGRP